MFELWLQSHITIPFVDFEPVKTNERFLQSNINIAFSFRSKNKYFCFKDYITVSMYLSNHQVKTSVQSGVMVISDFNTFQMQYSLFKMHKYKCHGITDLLIYILAVQFSVIF